MKRFLTGILTLLLFIQIAYAQSENTINISENPTKEEITDLFYKATTGEADPYQVLSVIIEKGDRAVEALEEYLYSEPSEQKNEPQVMWDSPAEALPASTNAQEQIKPYKEYAIIALEAISTPLSISALLKAANSGLEVAIHGEIIKMLAFNSYERAANTDSLTAPRKEILKVLIENADDTTYVEKIGMRTGQLSREGIKNWTGKDFGEVLIPAAENDIDLKAYRKNWWILNEEKISWSNEEKHFIIKN